MTCFERTPGWLAGVVVCSFGVAVTLLHFSGLLRAPMNDVLWGISISADPVSDLLFMHEFMTQLNNGCPFHMTLQNFPFGAEINIGLTRFLVPGFILLGWLYMLTKKIFLSFNLSIMILVFANFLVTYYCSFKFLNNRTLSLVPATLVAFSAYAYSHSWAHLGLMSYFYIPLFLFYFYRVQTAPKQKKWQFAAASILAFSAYCSPYYFYFNIWVAIAVFFPQLILAIKNKSLPSLIKANVSCVFTTTLLVLPFIYENFLVDLSNSWQPKNAQDYGKNLYFLTNYSARPSDYFLPNVHNPWFGDFFKRFIADANQARNWWSDEFSISIGIVPTIFLILLSLVGLRRLLPKNNKISIYTSKVSAPIYKALEKNGAIFQTLIILSICAFLLSLAPTITVFGVTVPTPNELLRYVVPFRSYSRFAIVFMLAISLLLALVIAETKRPSLWISLGIFLCILENFPKTQLHNVSSNQPYIEFITSRPEQVIMRFEQQNVQYKLPLKPELILTGKRTINGDINFNYGYTEWPLSPQNTAFNIGYLGNLGAELLVVNGRLQITAKEAPYLEELAYFADSDIGIWKVKSAANEKIKALLGPYVAKAKTDACYVAPKAEVQQVLRGFVQLIAQSPG